MIKGKPVAEIKNIRKLGGVSRLKGILRSGFMPNIQRNPVRVQEFAKEGRIEIYGNVTNEQITEILKNTGNGEFLGKHHYNYLGIQSAEEQSPKGSESAEDAREPNTGEIRQFNARYQLLETQNTKLQKDLDGFVQKTIDLEDQIKSLSADNASMRSGAYKDIAAKANCFHDIVRPYLSGLAKRVFELEEKIVEPDHFIKAPKRTTPEIFEEAKTLGFAGSSAREFFDLAGSGALEETVSRSYDDNNSAESKKYASAVEALKSISAEIEDTKTRPMRESGREGALKGLEQEKENMAKAAKKYEQSKKEFVEKVVKNLPVLAQELRDNLKFTELKHIVEAKSCSHVQVFADWSEDKDNYNLHVYVPKLKTVKESKLCNVLLNEVILNPKVRRVMKETDVMKNLSVEDEENSTLSYFKIKFAKSEYSPADVKKMACSVLDPSARTGYRNTLYSKLGIIPEVASCDSLGYFDFEAQEEPVAAPRVQRSRAGGKSGWAAVNPLNEENKKMYDAMGRILSSCKEINGPEFRKNLALELGQDVDLSRFRYAVKYLRDNGVIVSEGSTKAIRYALSPELRK